MDFFTTEYEAVKAEVVAVWTTKFEPYFDQFGIAAVAWTKNIWYDIEKAGKAGLSAGGTTFKALAGAELKHVFETVRITVGTVVAQNPNMSFGEMAGLAVKYLMEFTNWSQYAPAAVSITENTFGSMAMTFLSAILSGVLAGAF